MEIVEKASHIQKLKKLTEKLCDRDVLIKESLSDIEKITFCKSISSNDKIIQIKEIIENIRWTSRKTDGMNTQS